MSNFYFFALLLIYIFFNLVQLNAAESVFESLPTGKRILNLMWVYQSESVGSKHSACLSPDGLIF